MKGLKRLTHKIFQLVHEAMSHTCRLFVGKLAPVRTLGQGGNVDITKEPLNRMKNSNASGVQHTECCFLENGYTIRHPVSTWSASGESLQVMAKIVRLWDVAVKALRLQWLKG